MLNLGCPFMPGFKYLLERYFVMSSIPATDVACLSMRALLARSKMLAAWSASPTISQKILAGWHMASIWVPFFVHRKVPRSESIDFSQEGSFSTIHLGILLSLCTVLGSVFNQIYWLCLMVKASVLIFCAKANRYLFADVAINRKEQQTYTLIYIYNTSDVSEGDDAKTWRSKDDSCI